MSSNNCHLLSQLRTNKTTRFLLPLLGLKRKEYTNLVNAYIQDVSFDLECPETLFIIFKNNQTSEFKAFLNMIAAYTFYKTNYTICAGEYLVVVCELPEEFHEDYYKFIGEGYDENKSAYSKFSEEAKRLILTFDNGLSTADKTYNNYYGILHKTTKRRKEVEGVIGTKLDDNDELLSKIDKEEEVLDIEHIVAIVEKSPQLIRVR